LIFPNFLKRRKPIFRGQVVNPNRTFHSRVIILVSSPPHALPSTVRRASPPAATATGPPPRRPLPFFGAMVTRGGGSQSYGFPIYCAAWLPLAHIIKPDPPAAEADADDPSSSTPSLPMAVLGGGGGEGRSGVPNKLVVAALATGEEAAPALSPDTVSDPSSQIPL
jgi:hypothetical protein